MSYQTVGFHFRVTFLNLPTAASVDVAFQSVTGLDVEFETDSIKEGGENRFEHTVPGRTRYPSSLVLKRGVVLPGQSGLTKWCTDAFQKRQIKPIDQLLVELLDENHVVMAKWDVAWVWPKSWKVGELNAERSEVLIETLELHYNRFEFKQK